MSDTTDSDSHRHLPPPARTEQPSSKTLVWTKRLGIAAIATGLVLCGTGAWFLFSPDNYRATTRIEVTHVYLPGVFDPYWIQSEFQVILSQFVLYRVIDSLNLNQKWGEALAKGKPLHTPETYALLIQRVELQVSNSSNVIDISVIDQSPTDAAQIANMIADTFRSSKLEVRQRWHSESETSSDPPPTDHLARIVERAVPPESPIGHNPLIGTILSSLGVIVVALGAYLVSHPSLRNNMFASFRG